MWWVGVFFVINTRALTNHPLSTQFGGVNPSIEASTTFTGAWRERCPGFGCPPLPATRPLTQRGHCAPARVLPRPARRLRPPRARPTRPGSCVARAERGLVACVENAAARARPFFASIASHQLKEGAHPPVTFPLPSVLKADTLPAMFEGKVTPDNRCEMGNGDDTPRARLAAPFKKHSTNHHLFPPTALATPTAAPSTPPPAPWAACWPPWRGRRRDMPRLPACLRSLPSL